MLVENPPVELAEDFWMLGVNAYPVFLARSPSEAALFEGGIGGIATLVARQLEGLGVPAEAVRQIAITHAHPDHVMALPQWRQIFPAASVLASAVAAKTLAVEKAVGFFAQIDGLLTTGLVESGTIGADQRPQAITPTQIAVDRVVKEGDQVPVGEMSFDVLETPGHSPCSLSFYEPRRKILVISDATGFYMPRQAAWWPCYFTGYREYLDSIRRLAALPAEVVCLSHNGAIRGAEAAGAYFQGALAATEAYHARIVAEARAGKQAGQIAEQLGGEIHRETGNLPLDFFQKNCALLVKQSLRHEGMAG
jgi:glyoxylase-like metal-dependent hydrolase (beta-lactamase superfamily II)